ncbi:putative ubiquitin-conjugating enzyme E2 38 [Tasmannia lanceolata]|uniref:putative ubiquitin-conjugating enzyme E2 38 n=1 Tax=Tasmannia lanceolata TaxID=3420 RepID=UPI0040639CD0
MEPQLSTKDGSGNPNKNCFSHQENQKPPNSELDISSSRVPTQPSSSNPNKEIEENPVEKKFKEFNQFDAVSDYSDHAFIKSKKKMSTSNEGAKQIQKEWKILSKNLPESIFVRVYEERLDLMRAVIIGAQGTPYQDGLFFFDIFFPANYPAKPPEVYYYSRGLRLNPNLYGNGKVCLSLLNTWHGKGIELWVPGKSTILQLLLSIQGLVLNSKPFFNEPGFGKLARTKFGMRHSLSYNQEVFVLSCKTMVYTLRRPPKHFENFVVGHFRLRACSILEACNGCNFSSERLCGSMRQLYPQLVAEFTRNGADCGQFLHLDERFERDDSKSKKGFRNWSCWCGKV